jgi:hypothetical protein
MAKRPPAAAPVAPLILCPKCQREMRLFGIEAERPGRDLFTFECTQCARLEVRGVSTV